MADELSPQTTTPAAPAAPAPQEIPEERLKALVKERWGIDDDPDTFKRTRQQEREAAELIPRYQAAVTELARRAQLAQTPAPKPPEELDEATLRDQARLDPYVALKYVTERERRATESRLQAIEQTTYSQMWSAQAERANRQLADWWPEAHDKTSPLHQEGMRIFQSMSQEEQARPDSGLRATQLAAGLLGLAPKPKRTTETHAVADDVAGQRTGGRTPRPASEEPVKLNDRQKKIAKAFGLKEKEYGKARVALGEGSR